MTDYYRVQHSPIVSADVNAAPGDVIQPSEALLSAFSDNLEPESEASDVSLKAVNEGTATLADVPDDFSGGLEVVASETAGDDTTSTTEESASETEQSTNQTTTSSTETDDTTPAPAEVVPDDYDDYSVDEVEEWAESANLSTAEVEAAIEYEKAHSDRVTAVEALEEEL